MVSVKIQTREVTQEDLPQTTLEVLTKDTARIYLDTNVLSRDYNEPMQSYLDHLREYSSYGGYGGMNSFRIKQKHEHIKSFLETINASENIITSSEVIYEYDQYLYLLKRATNYFNRRYYANSPELIKTNKIIEFHEDIYDLLQERLTPYKKCDEIDFQKFLRESTLHKPYDGKFQKNIQSVTPHPSFADSELVGSALDFSYWSAREKNSSKVAIITADKDLPNLVRNFGTTTEGAICRGLGVLVEVYFPSNNWRNNLGVEFQSDSTGFNKYENEKTEIIVEL